MFKLVLVSAVVALALADVSHLADLRSSEARAAILRQTNEIIPPSSYAYSFETENNIAVQEQGEIRETGPETADKTVQGSASWISPEGEHVSLSYVADANGYQPQGSHLPVAPPIPEEILKSLKWNAAHPEEETEQ